MQKTAQWLLVAALIAGIAAPAAAQAKPRVAVMEVQGPLADKVQRFIAAALRDEVEIVETNGANTLSGDSDYAAVAQAQEIQAFVIARVEKARRYDVTITVRQGSDGTVVGEETWSEGKPAKLSVIERELWTRIGPIIQRARPPEPEPVETAPVVASDDEGLSDEEEEDDSSDSPGQLPALRVELAFGPMWRDQAYNDAAISTPFRYYNKVGAPSMWLGLSTAIYPLAFMQDGPLANIGIVLGFGLAIAADSATASGESIPTSASAFHVGGRFRLPIDPALLGLTVAFGQRTFTTDVPPTLEASTPIPDVGYRFVRIAVDGEIKLADALNLELNGGYLVLLKSGELADAAYFPNLTGGGVEFGLGGAYKIGDTGISLRAAFDWQRFFFTLNPAPGAMRVAGGSTDDYYTFTLGGRYELTR